MSNLVIENATILDHIHNGNLNEFVRFINKYKFYINSPMNLSNSTTDQWYLVHTVIYNFRNISFPSQKVASTIFHFIVLRITYNSCPIH